LKFADFNLPGGIVWCYLHHSVFSHCDTIPACDRWTHDNG